MNRSNFIRASIMAAFCWLPATAQERDLARERLVAITPTKADVDNFLRGKQGPEQLSRNNGWLFDADLGWVLCDSIRSDGVHKSKTFYHYEADGARKVVNFPDRTCRIHTYGDSFTHGDQVSDGETWQEYLAAHLQEPIRNYGVGGYSVYQAYRRMLKVEEKTPAKYIILNIYDDDHYRNLDSLRSIRFGRRIPDGFTLPHLRVDVAGNRCDKVENLLRKPEDAYRLSDEEFVYKTFKDDPVLRLVLAAADKKALTAKLVEPIAASFGIPTADLTDPDRARQLEMIHTKAALFATRNVITWTEQYTAKTGKKLLIVLSFNQRNMRLALDGKPRFDQELLDWLKDKPYPVIDMRDVFRRDFAKSNEDAATYLARYYIGHHSPAGNFFTAWALRETLVKWLDPPPLPYRAAASSDRSAAVRAEARPVEITVRDKKTGQLIPCRVHLKDAAGKAQRAADLPFWFDHFVCPGTAKLNLDDGKYSIEIERGPEYARIAGTLEVGDKATRFQFEIERLIDLTADGWWSGDLHVHRPVAAMELLMRAEDLHVAPVITWWNKQNLWDKQKPPADPLVRFDGRRFYHVMAGEDEREGGALLFFHLRKPLAIATSSNEYPSSMKYVAEARLNEDVWIDIEKPFWWDVAMWLAGGQMHSIGLANNHMCRDRMYETEAWGKPRLAERLPAPLGNGYWTQEIYYHVLNTGLRLPPSAGSASGVLPNPVGYNRVVVHVGPELTHDKWWAGLRAGRSFVTNGPLLRVKANGKLPGEIFSAGAGKEIKIDVEAALTTQDPIRFLEIIKNGQVERKVSYQDWSKTGSLGAVTFKESGWFLVRAIADNKTTFRFASTAPFYVEIGPSKRRVSKASSQFFLDWARERMNRITLDDDAQRKEVLQHHLHAEKYWQERVANANVD